MTIIPLITSHPDPDASPDATVDGPARARPPATTVDRSPSRFARPLIAYAISRLVVLLATLPALFMPDPGGGPWPGLPSASKLAVALSRWDGAWYVWVAQRGYPNAESLDHHLSDVAFYPAYPASVRGLATLFHLSLPTAAVLAATAFGAVSAVLVWLLADRIASRGVADRAVLLYVMFPGAFVLSMAYAESLMIMAMALCLLMLLDRRWLLAGLAGALATAARPNALAIVFACAGVALVEIVRRRQWKALLAPLVAGFGVAAYYGFLWIHSRDPLAWFRSEHVMWHDQPALITPVWHRATAVFGHWPSLQPGGLNDLVGAVGLVVTVGAIVLLARSRMPLAVKLFTLAALVVPLTSVAVGPRPRMLLAAFPMAIIAARRLSPRGYQIAVAASVVGLIAMTVLTTTSLTATP